METAGRLLALAEWLSQADRPLPIREIASRLGVSPRTVRSSLDRLDAYLSSCGGRVVRRPRVGVWVEGISQAALQELRVRARRSPALDTPSERERLIILRLLSGHCLSLKQLCDLLYVSRSTLHRHMRHVRGYLARYGLRLERIGSRIRLVGSEVSIRQALADLFVVEPAGEQYGQSWGSLDGLVPGGKSDLSLRVVEEIVRKAVTRLPYELAEESLRGLALHLTIAALRFTTGQLIEGHLPVVGLEERQEFLVAEEIAKRLEAAFGVKVPAQERKYIALRILAARLGPPEASLSEWQRLPIDPVFLDLAYGFARVVGSILSVPVHDDKQFILALALHLQPAITRLRLGIGVRNPLLAVIRERYPLFYLVATTAALYLREQTGLQIPPEEAGYLAVHIGAALERLKGFAGRVRVLLVCPAGVGSSEFLRMVLCRRFPELEVAGVSPAFEAAERAKQLGVSLVISTVPISLKDPPVVVVSPLPGPSDLAKLSVAVGRAKQGLFQFGAAGEQASQFMAEGAVYPVLEEVLTPDVILLDALAGDWEEAVTMAGRLLVSKGFVEEAYVRAMIANVREVGAYVVVGPGIAMPHARPDQGVHRVGVSLVRLKKPVVFPGKEDNPVDLIIAFAAEANNSHLAIMAKLAAILSDANLVRVLREARGADEILDMVRAVRVSGEL